MAARNLKQRLFALTVMIALTAALVFLVIDQGMKPTIIEMAEARVEFIAIRAMNNSVMQILGSHIKYTDLINVMTDSEGRITMLQQNTIMINALASATSSMAQDEIWALGQQGIEVPLGSVTRSKLLAGLGPNIPIKIIPIGSVATDFDTEFVSAGINQTRHKVYLILQTQVRIVVPLGSEVIQVSTRVPITETIIVGEVPLYYVHVEERSQMLPLIPRPD